jgi:hypothetical protein
MQKNQSRMSKNLQRSKNKIRTEVRAAVNMLKKQQGSTGGKKKRSRRNRNKNQTREITDFPLGTSQRSGFNRNLASKTLSKDEYIGEIAGTVAFTTTQYSVNPGQAGTFPWLSIEAKQWEKYEFLKLEFYLKPEVTQYTTNANSGKVILSFDSDASDAPPLNKQEAEDILPMADGMSYQTVTLDMPKFIMKSHLDSFYVRPGNLPGGSDIKTYDLGNLFVSTIGQGGAVVNMMELRVRYTVKLMIPILENIAAAPQNNSVTFLADSNYNLTSGVGYTVLYSAAKSNYLAVTNGNNVVNTAGSIVPPPGNYLLEVNFNLVVTNGTNSLTSGYVNILKNGFVQNPCGVAMVNTGSFGFDTTSFSGVSGYPMAYNLFISCNGTDVITTFITAIFTDPSRVTTTFRLTSV